jgi:hypothetical protein
MGFTLIELQVATFISFITLLATLSLYIFYWRTFSIGNTILDVYSNSRVAIGYLAKDIRLAAQVMAATPDNAYQTTDHCVVLQIASINNTAADIVVAGNVVHPGNVIPNSYDNIVYKLQGSDLYRVIKQGNANSRPNENRAIGHYCTSLTFRSGSGATAGQLLSTVAPLSDVNALAITLPLNKTTTSLSGAGTETESMTPTTTVSMRNK